MQEMDMVTPIPGQESLQHRGLEVLYFDIFFIIHGRNFVANI